MNQPIHDTVRAADRELYLDLMKKALTNIVYGDPPMQLAGKALVPWASAGSEFDPLERALGEDWPTIAHTMSGIRRLDSLQDCLERVVSENVPGDLIETGTWRGGVCIFMRAFLKAYGIEDRTVWVADSFEGAPKIGADGHVVDYKTALHHANHVLGVSLAQVETNFAKYDLLDDQVRFLAGWFRDTLPTAPIDTLALLRLDTNLYGSTWDSLTNLYPKLSPGGYLIVGDYALPGVRHAVLEYRKQHGVSADLEPIDTYSVRWRHEG